MTQEAIQFLDDMKVTSDIPRVAIIQRKKQAALDKAILDIRQPQLLQAELKNGQ